MFEVMWLKILVFAIAILIIAIAIIFLFVKALQKFRRLISKKSRMVKAVVCVIMLMVIALPFIFLVKQDQQKHKEWYSLRKTIIGNHPVIKSAKIRVKGQPLAYINFYINAPFEFADAEVVFVDFLANFSDDFIEELERIKFPNSISGISVHFISDGMSLYRFESNSRDYSQWSEVDYEKPADERKNYNLDDYNAQ